MSVRAIFKPTSNNQNTIIIETDEPELKNLQAKVSKTNRIMNNVFYGLKGRHSERYSEYSVRLSEINRKIEIANAKLKDAPVAPAPVAPAPVVPAPVVPAPVVPAPAVPVPVVENKAVYQLEIDKLTDEVKELEKEIITNDKYLIENSYIKRLSVNALKFIFVSILIGLGAYYLSETNGESDGLSSLITYSGIWTGSMIGVWIKRILSREDVSDHRLLESDDEGILSIIRLFFAGVISILIFAILKNEIIIIEIGELNYSEIDNSIEVALVFGVLTGMINSKLANTILKKLDPPVAQTKD